MNFSTPRLILPDDDEGGLWLDRLLSVSLELPFEKGEEAVANAFLDALATMFPTYTFGIRSVSDYGERRTYGRSLPPEPFTPPAGSRLFDDSPYENVAWLGEIGGSSLHVGGEDADLGEPDSDISRVTLRAAEVLRGAFEHVHVYASRTSSEGKLRALESGMVQADKMASFGQLAAGIIHELNNPLTAIVSYTDYLLIKVAARGAAADADELERLHRIRESAQRLVQFTHDLVNYARPTRETPGPANLHDLIDKAVAFCDHLVSQGSVEIEREFNFDGHSILCVPRDVEQVFVNLITNACHASPETGGFIRVSTSLVQDQTTVGSKSWLWAEVRIQDNGHGVEPVNLPQLFTPFFTTKEEGRGTGLGLWIVKGIVEKMGGTIRVESQVDRGTTFILRLPAYPNP